MKIYFLYLQQWPYPHLGVMNTLSLFSLKHFGALLFNMSFGVILGIEHIFENRKQNGKWHIDYKRLLIMGIPALLLSVEAVHFFLIENILKEIGMGFSNFHLAAPAREPFFRILLGYVLVTSFYKE